MSHCSRPLRRVQTKPDPAPCLEVFDFPKHNRKGDRRVRDAPGCRTGRHPRFRRTDSAHCSHTGPLTMASPPDGEKKFRPMSKKQVAHFEKRLLEERKRVLRSEEHT